MTKKEKKAEYSKLYRAKNRERLLLQKKEYRENNKDKTTQYTKEYYEKNREKVLAYSKYYGTTAKGKYQSRATTIRKKYNIEPENVMDLMDEQKGCCYICGESFSDTNRYCIDHNHDTGEVRSLLCTRCNILVGSLESDSVLLEKVGQYIHNHERANYRHPRRF